MNKLNNGIIGDAISQIDSKLHTHDIKIDALEQKECTSVELVKIAEIEHGLGEYVDCVLYSVFYAAGIGGAGEGPAGGSNLTEVNTKTEIETICELDGFDKVIIHAPKEYENIESITKADDNTFYLSIKDNGVSGVESLVLTVYPKSQRAILQMIEDLTARIKVLEAKQI